MCLISRSAGSGLNPPWPKALEDIRQREMASKTNRHAVRLKSIDAEYVSMRLASCSGTTLHMEIALRKHSAHVNILLNPDEDLRKRLYLMRLGDGRPIHRGSTRKRTC